MKKVFFISFDYLPSFSPGAIRAKVFAQKLASSGYEVSLLTSTIKSGDVNKGLSSEQGIHIYRVRSIDATKVLSFFGKSFSYFSLPDRWWPWIIRAWQTSIDLIKRKDIDIIFVSIPTYSASVLSTLLAKVSGLPLIVDLRDPFRFRYDPKNVSAHFLFKFIEKSLITRASKVITTTRECGEYYQKLYPSIDRNKFVHIANGYDEESLFQSQSTLEASAAKFTLLHSGTLYSIGRDPDSLLLALSLLKNRGIIRADSFQFVVRGSPPWPALNNRIEQLGLEEFIVFKGFTNYIDSLIEMKKANALVIIQGGIFQTQVPSKLYDYLASLKPIIAVTNIEYATGKEATRLGIEMVSVMPEDLAIMLEKLILGKGSIVEDVSLESRQEKSKVITQIFNQVLDEKNGI